MSLWFATTVWPVAGGRRRLSPTRKEASMECKDPYRELPEISQLGKEK
jgi:hypothetical protein